MTTKNAMLVIALCLTQQLAAQPKTKPAVKPHPAAIAKAPVNSKAKDSINKLLTAGNWVMSYYRKDGKKIGFTGKADAKELPSMRFDTDGTFHGYNNGDDITGKWSLSADGKRITTIENNNTDTLIIAKITGTELELTLKGTKDTMGFVLRKP